MADIEEKKDEELIPVETPPAEEDKAPKDEHDDDHEDDEVEDDRLAEHEDGEEDPRSANNRRRRQRREAQRRAREAQDRRIDELIAQNKALQERVGQIEGHSVQSTIHTLDEGIRKALADMEQAELIEAKALSANNGEDAVLARRIRDAAMSQAQQLQARKQQLVQARDQAQQPQAPDANPMRDTWLQANPWFGQTGNERHTALVRGIDSEIAAEGYDPKSPEYWSELTQRASAAIRKLEGEPKSRAAKPGNGGPPTGGASEHPGPRTGRNEIYVTPERKQAMIDAGVWDDPVARQKYLKAYREYDNQNAAR